MMGKIGSVISAGICKATKYVSHKLDNPLDMAVLTADRAVNGAVKSVLGQDENREGAREQQERE